MWNNNCHMIFRQMKLKDKEFELYITADELSAIVDRIAESLEHDLKNSADVDGLIVCPVMTGAFVFAADLVRRLRMPLEVRPVRYASYSGMCSTGTVRCEQPFPESVKGREVLIVEDVIDSGLTVGRMLEDLKPLGPKSVKVCTLLMKPGMFKGGYRVDYIGKEIGDEFIVGYGMDYDEQGRGLPEVWRAFGYKPDNNHKQKTGSTR